MTLPHKQKHLIKNRSSLFILFFITILLSTHSPLLAQTPLSSWQKTQIAHFSTGQIQKVPQWWFDLRVYMQGGKFNSLGLNATSLESYAMNSSCQVDVPSTWILQTHGESILAGIKAHKTNPIAAKAHFQRALQELEAFSSSLTCLHVDGIRYWDFIFGVFLQDVIAGNVKSLQKCEAIQALWNPSLLVLDLIQHTGESEIIDTFNANHNLLTSCLSSYPVDSYGAAILPTAVGGKLVRFPKQSALSNLLQLAKDPKILGFGLCSLADHANKAQATVACIAGLSKMKSCSNSNADQLLKDLGLSTLQTQHLPIPGGLGMKTVYQESVPKSFFGTGVSTLLNHLSIRTPSCGNNGGGGSGGYPNLKHLDGCMLSIVMGKEVSQSRKSVLCAKRHKFNPAKIEVTKVKFPPTQCGLINPEKNKGTNPKRTSYGSKNLRKKVPASETRTIINKARAAYNKNLKPFSQKEVDGIIKKGDKVKRRKSP